MFEVDEMSIGYNKIINKAILRVHVINNSNLLKWKGYTWKFGQQQQKGKGCERWRLFKVDKMSIGCS